MIYQFIWKISVNYSSYSSPASSPSSMCWWFCWSHQESKPKPDSFMAPCWMNQFLFYLFFSNILWFYWINEKITTIRYGVLISLWLDVEGLSLLGGPIGELSSNTSPDTRNLIGSPISIYKSCVPPSSNGYSHTQACSASSNRDGCWRAVGGIRISSKKPRVTANCHTNS